MKSENFDPGNWTSVPLLISLAYNISVIDNQTSVISNDADEEYVTGRKSSSTSAGLLAVTYSMQMTTNLTFADVRTNKVSGC